MPDDELIEVVITAPDEEWLVAFTKRLVEQRLAACGHHVSIRSVYTWNEQIYDRREARVALHTRAEHFASIASLIDADHPSEVTCVVAVPLIASSRTYRAWVVDSTAPSAEPQS